MRVVEFSPLDAKSSEWDEDLKQVKIRKNRSTTVVVIIAIIISWDLKVKIEKLNICLC